jgi:hypothetical protein
MHKFGAGFNGPHKTGRLYGMNSSTQAITGFQHRYRVTGS